MKSARPHSEASALDPRSNHTADLFADLLPARPAPILPRPGTVKAAALQAIIEGRITQAEFRRSWRLAAYVGELIDDGWIVCSEWVTLPGWSDPVKKYWIDLSDPETSAAVSAYQKRAGFITAELAALLALAVVSGLMLLGVAA